MILYTMMPQELIFGTEAIDEKKRLEVEIDGVPLLVEMTADYDYEVIRVMSSNPNHFLDARFSPGCKISMRS